MKAAPKLRRVDARAFVDAAARIDVLGERAMSMAYALSLDSATSDASFLRCMAALDFYIPRWPVYGGTATVAATLRRSEAVIALLLLAAIAEAA